MKVRGKRSLTANYNTLEYHLEMISALMPGNFYWKDKKGRYLGCNLALINMLGLKTVKEIVGKTDVDLWPEQANQLRNNDLIVMTSGKPIYLEEVVDIPPHGRMYFTVVKIPWINNDGKVVGIIGNSLDITELKITQHLLQLEKEKAQSLTLAKTEFLINMSHDIKTPIAGIIGLSGLLQNQLLGEPLELIEDILSSANKVMEFFDHCLSVMKSDKVNALLTKEPFRLAEIFQKIEALFLAPIKDKRLTFNIVFDPNIPDTLWGSPEAVHRILINLVGNAIKFTHEGSIIVGAKLSEKSNEKTKVIKLFVKDTGIGIPKDKQHIIFEQFTRLTPSYQGIYTGTGLGLFEINKLVNSLEGEIKVNSAEGKGSEFIVALAFSKPLLDPSEYRSDDPITENSSINLLQSKLHHHIFQTNVESTEEIQQKRSKVLLVEDDYIAQRVVKQLLSDVNCEVDVAASGDKALEFFAPGKYDLIIMDIGLPDTTGDIVTQQIRKLEGDSVDVVPVIALTAHPLSETLQTCRAAGMQGILKKPLSKNQAVQLIKRYSFHQAIDVENLETFNEISK